MTDVKKPTPDDIYNAFMEEDDDYEEAHEHADPSWRHGCYMTTVYRRISDETYWQVFWQRSGDGEYNTIRERELDDHSINRVWPYETVTVDWTTKDPNVEAA